MLPNSIILFSLFVLTSCIQMTGPTDLKFSSSAIRTPASLEYQSELQMSDRQYVESVLLSAFDARGSAEAGPIQQHVYEKVEFGGGCDKYEASELNGNYEFYREYCWTGMKSNSVPSSIPSRYSYTMKICEYLVNSPNRQQAFLAKYLGSATASAPTRANIVKAYGAYYIEVVPSAEIVDALMSLSQSDAYESWKQINLAICSSPGWQVLL